MPPPNPPLFMLSNNSLAHSVVRQRNRDNTPARHRHGYYFAPCDRFPPHVLVNYQAHGYATEIHCHEHDHIPEQWQKDEASEAGSEHIH